jgi:hypothetical protein
VRSAGGYEQALNGATERMARALGVKHVGVNTDGGKCGLCRAHAKVILGALLNTKDGVSTLLTRAAQCR